MPNPYESLFNSKKKVEEPFEEVEGGMSCQTCHELVREGRYYTNVQLLVWVCSQGHKSHIKDISL